MHRVLITGAGGGIGRSLRESLRGTYPILRLSDRVPLGAARAGEEVCNAELYDREEVERIVADVDGCPSSGFLRQPARQNKGGSGASVW